MNANPVRISKILITPMVVCITFTSARYAGAYGDSVLHAAGTTTMAGGKPVRVQETACIQYVRRPIKGEQDETAEGKP